jgi:hypothetical protein
VSKSFRHLTIAIAIFTLAMLPLIWGASYGRVPNDSGIIAMIAAFPTSLLFSKALDYSALREASALFLGLPVNDRFAMVFDAFVGWLLGCFQYGSIAIIFPKVLHLWRLSSRGDNE